MHVLNGYKSPEGVSLLKRLCYYLLQLVCLPAVALNLRHDPVYLHQEHFCCFAISTCLLKRHCFESVGSIVCTSLCHSQIITIRIWNEKLFIWMPYIRRYSPRLRMHEHWDIIRSLSVSSVDTHRFICIRNSSTQLNFSYNVFQWSKFLVAPCSLLTRENRWLRTQITLF